MDPLAEDFPGWTPYHYVHNNPINLVDPTGMRADPPENGSFKNGDVHTDSDGSWTFNNGMWHDNLGGENNFIPEIIIGKSDSNNDDAITAGQLFGGMASNLIKDGSALRSNKNFYLIGIIIQTL